MNPEELKNWDKISPDSQDIVRFWCQITTVTINDDGLFMLDLIPYPATPNAYMFKDLKNNDET